MYLKIETDQKIKSLNIEFGEDGESVVGMTPVKLDNDYSPEFSPEHDTPIQGKYVPKGVDSGASGYFNNRESEQRVSKVDQDFANTQL